MNAVQYTDQVARRLRDLDPAIRAGILEDVRAHFAEAEAEGRTPDAAAAALGSPADFAAGVREQFGVGEKAGAAARVLQIAAVAVAALTAVLVPFIWPLVIGPTAFLGATGLGFALLLMIPAALAAVPLFVPARLKAMAAVIVAILLTAVALLTWDSLGTLLMPVVVLVWFSALPDWGRTAAGRGIAAFTVLLPAAGLALLLFSGAAHAGTATIGIIVVLVLLAIGVFLGWRIGYVLCALAGAAITIGVLVQPGLLFLAIWWAGGLLLAIGLSGWAAPAEPKTPAH